MYLATFAQSIALAIALSTGLAVLFSNRQRGLNQAFAAFCLTQAVWIICIMVLTVTKSDIAAYWFLLGASVSAAAMPVSFNAVRLAVLYPDYSVVRLLSPNFYWVLLLVAVSLLCFTPVFLLSVVMPPDPNPEGAIIEPVYGIGFPVYAAYLVISFIILIGLTIRDAITLSGLAKNEMQILLMGLFACIFVGCSLGLIPPLFFGTSAGSPWTPVCIMLINVFVAFGIATHRIMGVEAVVRRTVAYILLGVYFLAIFSALYVLSSWLLPIMGFEEKLWPALVTSLTTIWLFERHSKSVHSMVNRLFGQFGEVDLANITKRSVDVLDRVTETHSLFPRFHSFLTNELGTDDVHFILFEEPTKELSSIREVECASVSKRLRTYFGEHLTLHISKIDRFGGDILPEELMALLPQENTQVALSITDTMGHVVGLILIGERRSGRIFSSNEIEALGNLAVQFSRSLNNSKLFTKVERNRQHVQLLIDNLTVGVFAVNQSHAIAYANPEANRLFNSGSDLVGTRLGLLPKVVVNLVETCLNGEQTLVREETQLPTDSGEVPVRIAVQKLTPTPDNDGMCALAYCEDLKAFRSLEQQLLRADRLSHFGRLSASVAHEVKNPLTAIQAYIQLLPENMGDRKFLTEFSQIMGGEVSKIDNTVHQLLDFAQDSHPDHNTVDVHDAIRTVSRLINAELKTAGMKLVLELEAENSLVTAARAKLEQVILNIALNAKEAISSEKQGIVKITTSTAARPQFSPNAAISKEFLSAKECACITIEDNGPGFSKMALESAFEPFFTTKDEGTGLGLAIVFGIIKDMGGGIDIGNKTEGGARISVYLPTTTHGHLSS